MSQGGVMTGNGSGLTNLDWNNIDQNMPAGFADGLDNEGGGEATNVHLWSTNLFIQVYTNGVGVHTLNAQFTPQIGSAVLSNVVSGTSNLYVGALTGNGSGLTNLDGSNISSGTVADARIASTIARDSETLDATNSFYTQLKAANTSLLAECLPHVSFILGH